MPMSTTLVSVWGGERLAGAHLADDLGRAQVPHEAHPRRRAEPAAHAAPGLARDAQGERSRAPPARSTCGMSTLSIAAARAPSAVGREMEQQLPRAVRASATNAGSRRPTVKVAASRARSARAGSTWRRTRATPCGGPR